MGARFLFLLTCLVFLQAVIPGNAFGDLGVGVVALSNGRDIGVLSFEIDDNFKLNEVAHTIFPARGNVGFTDIRLKGSTIDLKYTYVIDGVNLAQLAQVELDEDLNVLRHVDLKPEYGRLDLSTFYITNKPSKFRLAHANGGNLGSSKITRSGKVKVKTSDLFDFNDGGEIYSGDVSWDGTWGGQFRFFETGRRTAEFVQLNPDTGKKTGTPLQFNLTGNAFNLRLSNRIGGQYRANFLELKQQDGKDRVGGFSIGFDANTGIPFGSPVRWRKDLSTKFAPELFFGGMDAYNFGDDRIAVFHAKDKGGKLNLNLTWLDTATGNKVGKDQLVIGGNHPFLQNRTVIRSISAVGYMINDGWRLNSKKKSTKNN